MIQDYNLVFSDNQRLASVTSAVINTSTNFVDLGAAGTGDGQNKDAWGNSMNNQLNGGSMKFCVQLHGSALASAGLLCILKTNAAVTAWNNAQEVCRIRISQTSTDSNYGSAGKRFAIGLPQGIDYKRYLGVTFLGDGGSPAAISIDAWLGKDMEGNYSLAA